ncbi:MAG TPA: SOS response-associated peptidase [Pirellulaceae bacterium]|nr:SOS response-associated peptidase [Pirellulaceae bacterium]
MCGRYTLRTPMTVLAQQFLFELDASLEGSGPRYNIAPTQDVAAVRIREAGGKRELAFFHWGLIPPWAKDAKIAYSTINARADTVAAKPAFRAAFKKRRCLVLADGFYEWQRSGKTKLPFLYEVDGGKPFALAGLWESWRGPEKGDGPPLESCALITTDANELASQIHDRMPVILDAADYDAWLDPENQDRDGLEALLAPFPAERMTARAVSTVVNNARNDGSECVELRST